MCSLRETVSVSSSCLCHVVVVVVVVVQLCVSDGVEDLMESLTVESEKSLSSQEPDSHHSVGPSAEHLQGENSLNTTD